MWKSLNVLSEQSVLASTPLVWLFLLHYSPTFLFREVVNSPSLQGGATATCCTQKKLVLSRSVPDRLPGWCILVNKVLMTRSDGHRDTEASNQRAIITFCVIFHISLKKTGFSFSLQRITFSKWGRHPFPAPHLLFIVTHAPCFHHILYFLPLLQDLLFSASLCVYFFFAMLLLSKFFFHLTSSFPIIFTL